MKNNKKERKNDKAITLIALVVTIIILLILAGVSVGLATNGTGLFEKAKLATEKYENAKEDENDKITQYSNEIEFYSRAENLSLNFSLDEKIVGTWIDGKNIYQKSFYYEGDISSSNLTLFELPNNIDYVVDLKGTFFRHDVESYNTFTYCDNGPDCALLIAYPNTGYIGFYTDGGIGTLSKISATILYTKK